MVSDGCECCLQCCCLLSISWGPRFLLRWCRFPFLRLLLGLSKAEKERGDWVFFFVIKNGMSQIPFNAREGEDVSYSQITWQHVRISCYI